MRRTHLLGRLAQERDCPLILLRAPAGYGKTTLLTQWAQENDRPCAWVTMDDADADAGVLADSIAHALSASGITPGGGESFALILDDAHVVGSAALRDYGARRPELVARTLPAGSLVAL